MLFALAALAILEAPPSEDAQLEIVVDNHRTTPTNVLVILDREINFGRINPGAPITKVVKVDAPASLVADIPDAAPGKREVALMPRINPNECGAIHIVLDDDGVEWSALLGPARSPVVIASIGDDRRDEHGRGVALADAPSSIAKGLALPLCIRVDSLPHAFQGIPDVLTLTKHADARWTKRFKVYEAYQGIPGTWVLDDDGALRIGWSAALYGTVIKIAKPGPYMTGTISSASDGGEKIGPWPITLHVERCH